MLANTKISEFKYYPFGNKKILITNNKKSKQLTKLNKPIKSTKKRKLSEIDDNNINNSDSKEYVCLEYKSPQLLIEPVITTEAEAEIFISNAFGPGAHEYNIQCKKDCDLFVKKEIEIFDNICHSVDIHNNKTLKNITIKSVEDDVPENIEERKATSCSVKDDFPVTIKKKYFNFKNLPTQLVSINFEKIFFDTTVKHEMTNLPNTIKTIMLSSTNREIEFIFNMIHNIINYGPRGIQIFQIDDFRVLRKKNTFSLYYKKILRKKNIKHIKYDYIKSIDDTSVSW
jgi:hypothetical protein